MGGPGGGGGGYATTGSIGATAGSGGDAVDECGLRFLLAMRHHTCLMRSLPPKHRAVLEEKVSETLPAFYQHSSYHLRGNTVFYEVDTYFFKADTRPPQWTLTSEVTLTFPRQTLPFPLMDTHFW